MTDDGEVRIATYNFLHGGSARRNGHMAAVLAATKADILLCQEARPVAQLHLEGNDIEPGDSFLWRPIAGRKWGSGILVRGRAAIEISVMGFEGWVVGAEIELLRKTSILNVHCPAGPGGYARTMHRLLDAIEPLAARGDVIIGGDFNVATGYRSADESVKISKAEVQLLDRLTGDFGLIPCWQVANPGKPLAQTLRWTANRAAPYHCDGIFVPRSWQTHLRSCNVLTGEVWDQLSDHNPVVAHIDLRSIAHDQPPTRTTRSGRKDRRSSRARS